MQLEPFIKFPSALMQCDGFISKRDGSPVPLTPTGKMIYAYMLNRSEYFVDKLESKHFETQATIAEKTGSEYKVVGRFLRLLMDHGVLEGKKVRPEGSVQLRWHYYKIHTDVDLWIGSSDRYKLIGTSVACIERTQRRVEQVVEEDSDFPF